jgi:hypothetical protein
LLGSEDLVWAVLRDLENSPLDEKEKRLFRFVSKVNRNSLDISADDMKPLYDVGWTDADILLRHHGVRLV